MDIGDVGVRIAPDPQFLIPLAPDHLLAKFPPAIPHFQREIPREREKLLVFFLDVLHNNRAIGPRFHLFCHLGINF